jgi:hypothetical protein
MNVTPTAKGSFLAGMGFWLLVWAALFKGDEVAEILHMQRWICSHRCLQWIAQRKSAALITTELINYGSHGIDPLGVSFALGGTIVNAFMIYLFLPVIGRLQRRRVLNA